MVIRVPDACPHLAVRLAWPSFGGELPAVQSAKERPTPMIATPFRRHAVHGWFIGRPKASEGRDRREFPALASWSFVEWTMGGRATDDPRSTADARATGDARLTRGDHA